MKDLGSGLAWVKQMIDLYESQSSEMNAIRTFPHEAGLQTFRALHELKYQQKHELQDNFEALQDTGIHSAYVINSPDLKTAIDKCISLGKLNDSASFININETASYVKIQHQFNDERNVYYSSQGVFSLIAGVAYKLIPDMPLPSIDDVIVGLKDHEIPDERFLSIVSKNTHLRSDCAYIKIPIDLWNMKCTGYNQNIEMHLNREMRYIYGIEHINDDNIATDVEANLIRDIKVAINANISKADTNLNIEKVANTLSISRSTLYRHLSEKQITYSDIVESSKKEIAFKLIKNSNLSMSEISQKLGYSNLSAFSRAFRRWYDVAPTHFR